MTRIRWLLALFGLVLTAADSQAQIFLPGRFGFGYGGLGFGLVRPRLAVGLGIGGFYGGGFGFGGGFGLAPFGFYRSQVTVVYTPPPIVLMPPPRLFLDDLDDDILPRQRPEAPRAERLQPLPPVPEEPPPKGDPVGGFRPLNPDNRARAREPMPPPPPEQAPPPKQEKPPEPPNLPPPPPAKARPPRPAGQPPELPVPPRPEADPQAEYARLIDFARTAFAAGEYGRAAHAFRQASHVVPNDPFAHFLLAQALFALGKYADAVNAIHTGLELQPDWPKVRFRPIELYGPNVADYAEHLRRLDEVVRQRPNDPILLFLYAYELWFDGRQEEARQLFQSARPKAVHPDDIERFLRALPPTPAL
jgi:hypothetical protein